MDKLCGVSYVACNRHVLTPSVMHVEFSRKYVFHVCNSDRIICPRMNDLEPLHNQYHFLPGALPILSLTFEAELAVGRIMRSRKDVGAAAGDFGAGAGRSTACASCLGREGIGGCCEGRIDGLRDAVLMVDERRLSVL